jgi:hypothetical protein
MFRQARVGRVIFKLLELSIEEFELLKARLEIVFILFLV